MVKNLVESKDLLLALCSEAVGKVQQKNQEKLEAVRSRQQLSEDREREQRNRKLSKDQQALDAYKKRQQDRRDRKAKRKQVLKTKQSDPSPSSKKVRFNFDEK